MKSNLKKQEKGFTIIEVLIVLAIAGLIMLIVFLAVPALQRNSRNTQRTNDAARIAGGINECLSNNNGDLTDCDTTADLANYVVIGDNQQLITMNNGNGTLDQAGFNAGSRCNNNAIAAGGGARAFAIGFQVESRGNPIQRCVGS